MEENKQGIKIPKKEMSKMYLNHFGIIFSNISIFILCLSVGMILSQILVGVFVALWVLFLALILILSLGLVLVIIPNYINLITNSGNILNIFSLELMQSIMIYAIPIAIVSGILSIICLNIYRTKSTLTRTIINSVALILLIVLLILILGGAF